MNCEYSSSPIKIDQLAQFVPKEWGHEEWIINNNLYCGKKLVFKPGYRCSLHFHKIKDETFYILSGKVLIDLQEGAQKSTRIMTPGDVQQITPGVIHRITALVPSEVMEFSTFHMDEDSYRVEPSGKIDVRLLGLVL